MGTHPIFESDFDCLTDGIVFYRFIMDSNVDLLFISLFFRKNFPIDRKSEAI